MHPTETFSEPLAYIRSARRQCAVFAVCLVLVMGVAGCAHQREAGRPQSQRVVPLDAASVLADLAAQRDAVHDFRATGKVTLELPDSAAIRRFYGHVAFERPDKLFVEGYHRASGVVVARITCSGEDFFVDFPREPDQTFYQLGGVSSKGDPLGVSPAAIVTELFFPEDWCAIPTKDFRITRRDRVTGELDAEVWEHGMLKRRLVLQTSPVAIVRSERLEEGRVVAVATFGGYQHYDGDILFPSTLHAAFPEEHSVLDLEITNPTFNVPLDASRFDVRAQMKAAGVNVAE